MKAMICRKRKIENKKKQVFSKKKRIGHLKEVIASLKEKGENEAEEFLEVF